ncbi:MAG: PQQ-dependent sugar dehydrogenase [Actinomycetota bacterium]|nr:PQQ-dependent sugar dehydrogenase [Actinomycetota bacterium]
MSLPTGFSQTTTVHGLSRPSAVAWTPDGRMLIALRDGKLRVINPTTGATVTPLTVPTSTYGDHGFLGLAVDAAYASNHYVYLLYTYENNAGDYSGPKVSELRRIQLSDTNVVTDQQIILGSERADGTCPAPANTNNCIPSETDSHSIGTVRADPDGTLWVGSGDAADGDGVQEGAFRTYDEQSYAGKILHVDRNGNGLPSHPFCPTDSDPSHICTKIYAKGFRNPFRFTLRGGGQGLVVGDVGWNTYEEVDLVQAGGDYGWPCWEGSIKTPSYQDDPRCNGPGGEYSKSATPPVHSIPHDGTGLAIVGGPTYVKPAGSGYPAGYDGKIFFGAYGAGLLNTLDPANANAVAAFGSGNYGWVDLESAPNAGGLSYAATGDLVYVDFGTAQDGTGSIGRVSYTPGRSPPQVMATATPTAGPAPLTIGFRGDQTTDPDGGPLIYDWDFGDGTAHSSAANPTHTYAYGPYVAWLTVTDSTGLSATDYVRIDAGGPTITSMSPANGSLYTDGASVPLQASATTTPARSPVSLSWSVILHHNTHIHDIGTFSGGSTSFTPLVNHDADSSYEITLTATDDNGVETSQTRTINPRTVTYTLASDPPGAPVSYGGTNQTAPFTATAAVGYQTSVSAADQFSSGDVTYTFDHWSDGGARLHNVTVPSGDATLTAVYRQPVSAPSAVTPSAGAIVTAAASKDRTGPAVSLTLSRRNLLRGRVNGMASDPSNINVVQVALRARSKPHGRCRWWSSLSRGLRAASSCARPRWMTAKLSPVLADHRSRPWTVNLKRGLPAGRYVLLVRAVDGAGNLTSKVGRATEIAVKV